ncbi:ABC transporter ATP-binding protein/permease [bacterium]|nr:ABC transporter ATP-binding protein/permease [bacterium]
MLELRNIKKVYQLSNNPVHALKGISMTLRDSEFVSILGPSGCGKTTTLNIIGGLDRYTEGDLLIDGRSTKDYKDKDWDMYRNHKVGFVFQSYNLIPHQNILSNVEIALTIANIDKKKRKDLAIEALTKVGLKSEIHKFPRQLSGGQMQRVAIARAIVNKPSVLLADEPTGALDSKTSIQVLDILKELSKECLVCMVTHNEELANKYSTRIIKLKDGEIVDDSNPFVPTEDEIEKARQNEKEANLKYQNKKGKIKKVGMPFTTALKLSLSNLKSKLGRTILTCFAGSIGIIGIALILSVSNGFNTYVKDVERSTLSQYPITLTRNNVDITALFASYVAQNMEEDTSDNSNLENNTVVPRYVLVDLLRNLANNSKQNDLKAFKNYIEEKKLADENYILQIDYKYNVDINVYDANYINENGDFEARKIRPFTLPRLDPDTGEPLYIMYPQFTSDRIEQLMSNMDTWDKVFDDKNTLKEQYDLLAGEWPSNDSLDLIYVVDENNKISDFSAYSTGLVNNDNGDRYISALFKYVTNPDNNPDPKTLYSYEFSYEDLLGLEYYIVPNSSYYEKDEVSDGEIQTFTNIKDNSEKMTALLNDENEDIIKVKVACVVRPNPNSKSHSINGTIGYSNALINKIIDINNNSDIVKVQEENYDSYIYDILGIDTQFHIKGKTWEQIRNTLTFMRNSMGDNKDQFPLSQAEIDQLTSDTMTPLLLTNYYGQVDKNNPSTINIYPYSFEDKDKIVDFITDYNSRLKEIYPDDTKEELDEKRITYNDYLSSIMGSVTTIINAITYVLIAFVSISLVVSSIMIAIITYISVIERTKEIGILRAMGASKSDVKNIFNAETFITGLISGLIGIAITVILNIPISMLVNYLAGIENVAVLPVVGGIALVIISFLLSVISGLIPSSYAAKCDPVIALRTE